LDQRKRKRFGDRKTAISGQTLVSMRHANGSGKSIKGFLFKLLGTKPRHAPSQINAPGHRRHAPRNQRGRAGEGWRISAADAISVSASGNRARSHQGFSQ
jgi:hypothetical protein